jgi:hypothetical protein
VSIILAQFHGRRPKRPAFRGALADTRRKLNDLCRQVQLISDNENKIADLDPDLCSLDVIFVNLAPCEQTTPEQPVHDIISDIIDWDQANKAYLVGEGQSGERYIQRLEAADRMAEIEARWLAIAAATAWLPQREPAETALP